MELMIVHLPYLNRDVVDIERWINHNLYRAYHQGELEQILPKARMVYAKLKPYNEVPTKLSRGLNLVGVSLSSRKVASEMEQISRMVSNSNSSLCEIANLTAPMFEYSSDIKLAKKVLNKILDLQPRGRLMTALFDGFYMKDVADMTPMLHYLSEYNEYKHYA